MAIIEKPENQFGSEQPFGDSEFPKPLSAQDSIRLIEMLENPLEPNQVLKKAVAHAKASIILRV